MRSAIRRAPRTSWVTTIKRRPMLDLLPQQQLVDLGRGDAIEPAARLVDEQDPGLEHKRTCQPGALSHSTREFRGHPLPVIAEADVAKNPVDNGVDLRGCFAGQPQERQRQILVQRQGIEERGTLEEKSHLSSHAGQVPGVQAGDVFPFNPDLPLLRLQERDDQLQRHALAGSAAAQNAECFPRANLKRYVSENRLFAEGLRHLLQDHRGSGAAAHSAVSGKMKKMNLISRTSRKMIARDETTTPPVAARPTPFAPSSVV